MALLRILFPLLFIAFSLGELGKVRLSNTVSLGLLDIVVGIIFFIWIIFIKKSKYRLKISIFLFAIVGFLSLIINWYSYPFDKVLVGSLYLVRWIIYVGLYFVVKDVGKRYENLITKCMILSGLVIILIGFFQYFTYHSLKNLYYLGWDDHMLRLFSSYLDPNFAGTLLVLYLIFLFIIRDKFKTSKKIIYSLNLTMILTFLSIILTYSRSAFLMLAVSAFFYSTFQKNYKIILSLVLSFILIIIILSPKFYIVNTNLLRIPSLEQRVQSTKEALTIFSKNPILGVGFNNYRFARERYIQKDWVPFPSHAAAGSDNSFAFVLSTTGIIGFFAYILLLCKIFKINFPIIKKNIYSAVIVTSLVGLIVNSLLLNSLFYSFVMVWIWILLGLRESNSRE